MTTGVNCTNPNTHTRVLVRSMGEQPTAAALDGGHVVAHVLEGHDHRCELQVGRHADSDGDVALGGGGGGGGRGGGGGAGGGAGGTVRGGGVAGGEAADGGGGWLAVEEALGAAALEALGGLLVVGRRAVAGGGCGAKAGQGEPGKVWQRCRCWM